MTSKHTPGPWDVEVRHTDDGAIDHVVYAYGDVASLHENARPANTKRAQASDARLIAAAPDLLAACEGLLRFHCCSDIGAAPCAACKQARAAIAKAKGKGESK